MKDTSAYPYFIEERLNRQITEDIKNDIQLLEDLDSVGFFTRVFLAEVHLTGEKLLGSIPNDAHKKEIRDFANFLRVISRKGREERVPLDFVGAKISVRVILIAKRFKLQDYGIDPYLTAIKWGIRNGRDSIYISGWGNEFVSAIKEIKKAVGGRILNVLRAYEYSIGGMTKGILLVCQPKSSYWAVIREAQSEVSEALREIVPEIAAGKIKIISVVRKRGVGFKVSVASTDPAIENAGMCINAQPAYIKRLKEKFPGEFAGFINWTDNIPQFIKNALRPLPLKSILELELDEENSVAFVKVQGEAAIRRAIGKSYSNLSLASELTGWYIKVTKVDEDEISAELKEIIAQDIEEVRCGEIEIIKLARMKGFGARVLVRWANKARAGTASRVCIGDRLCNLNKIRERIENEVIYFHDWYDKPEDLISECLYPLGKELIRSIEIHEDMGIAFITIRNAEGDRWALNKDNLELVEKITGYQLEIWDEKNPTTI